MRKFAILLFVACSLIACKSKQVEEDFEWNNDLSTQYNKLNAQEEEVDIKLFLARKPDWKMIQTGSGLRYYIFEKKDGPVAKIGDHVEVQFKVELLDGEVVDETPADEVVEFVVDRAQIETGVQEAVKYMREGEKAKLIIPSHLGHGVVGDLSKIPPLSVLVIEIYLHRINR